MPVPDFQTLMRPILDVLSDGEEHSTADLRDQLAVRFSLTDDDLHALLPSGRVPLFNNRVGWALSHLQAARLMDRPRRAVYALTPRGRTVLQEYDERVDMRVLNTFQEYRDYRSRRREPVTEQHLEAIDDPTPPIERIEVAHAELDAALAETLLNRIMDSPPEFFELLVLDLLRAMGYGGTTPEAIRHLGGSGDGGVDGVIDQDRLGLDQVYVQAKRWNPGRAVDRADVQAFVGALEGKRASKGVFITTARFQSSATEYAGSLSRRVVLIDGNQLTDLLIRHNVGAEVRSTIEIKDLDEDYFGLGVE